MQLHKLLLPEINISCYVVLQK